ncbi:MAG: hypothetical protein AB1743_03885 [Actinomycetota bacterium]
MRKSFTKLLLCLIFLAVVLFAVGCQESSSLTEILGQKEETRLSAKQLNDIKGQIGAEIYGFYPNNYGQNRVYGVVINGSKQDLKKVTFTVRFGKRGLGSKCGEVTVKDLPAGKKKSFDVATSISVDQKGEYNLVLDSAWK